MDTQHVLNRTSSHRPFAKTKDHVIKSSVIIVVGNKGSWEGVSILLESTQNRVCGSGSREDTSTIAKVNVYKYKVSASRVRLSQFEIFFSRN